MEGCFSHLLGADLQDILLNEREAEERYVEIEKKRELGMWLRGERLLNIPQGWRLQVQHGRRKTERGVCACLGMYTGQLSHLVRRM